MEALDHAKRMGMWFIEATVVVEKWRSLHLLDFLDSVLDFGSLKNRAIKIADNLLVHGISSENRRSRGERLIPLHLYIGPCDETHCF